MSDDKIKQVKIQLPVQLPRRGVGPTTELVWATPVKQREGFQLDNMPWYAQGYSFRDLVRATYLQTRNFRTETNVRVYAVSGVVEKSGYRTFIGFFQLAPFTDERYFVLRDYLRQREVEHELAGPSGEDRVSFSVPPGVDLHAVAQRVHQAGAHVQFLDPPGGLS